MHKHINIILKIEILKIVMGENAFNVIIKDKPYRFRGYITISKFDIDEWLRGLEKDIFTKEEILYILKASNIIWKLIKNPRAEINV